MLVKRSIILNNQFTLQFLTNTNEIVYFNIFHSGEFDIITEMKNPQLKKIIYFDGICNLCNWSVRFIYKYDKYSVFLFSSLQSEYSEKHLLHFIGPDRRNESIIYQDHHVYYTKSDAVLNILKEMGGIWSTFYVFKIIPKNTRDRIYDLIAKNRYRWFGKKDRCMIPPAESKGRFLD